MSLSTAPIRVAATEGACKGRPSSRPQAGVELLLMRFSRVGTGNSATTSQPPSPIAYTTLLDTTYTAYSLLRGSADTSLLYPSRHDVRLRDTAGCALVEKTRATLLRSSLTEALIPTRWMSDWISAERGRAEALWAEAAQQDEARA